MHLNILEQSITTKMYILYKNFHDCLSISMSLPILENIHLKCLILVLVNDSMHFDVQFIALSCPALIIFLYYLKCKSFQHNAPLTTSEAFYMFNLHQ